MQQNIGLSSCVAGLTISDKSIAASALFRLRRRRMCHELSRFTVIDWRTAGSACRWNGHDQSHSPGPPGNLSDGRALVLPRQIRPCTVHGAPWRAYAILQTVAEDAKTVGSGILADESRSGRGRQRRCIRHRNQPHATAFCSRASPRATPAEHVDAHAAHDE